MKIYFTASLTGKNLYEENYKKIIKILEDMDIKVVSDHVLTEEKGGVSAKSHEEIISFYKKISNWISQSDIVVAEVTYPSTNVGHEITLALEKGKPVIFLYIEGKEPKLLNALDSEKSQLIPYKPKDLKTILKTSIEEAQDQMDVRFNFFISPKIGAYLDWIAKQKKTPRAVFLRRLIEEHMKKNKDYNS
jgi:2'-deoxynucleoside 5'-phosphate N-hydrolase